MADKTTRLRIVADSSDAEQKLKNFGQRLVGFRDRFATGIGIDVASRVMNMLERIPRVMTQAVSIGVGFNSTLENTAISLAGIMRSIAPDSFSGFNDALDTSRALIRVLREEAKMTTATFQDLVEATQGLIGPALSGGVPLQQIPAMVSMVSRAVQSAMPGAPSYQILQEGRAMLTGNIGPDAQLAKQLGITNPMIKTAREQGRLYEFLEERMRGFNDAAQASMGTLTGLRSNLEDLVTMGLAEAMEGTHNQIKAMIRDLQQFAKDPDFKVAARTLGELAMNIVKVGGMIGKTVGGVLDEVQATVEGSPLAVIGAAIVAKMNGAGIVDSLKIGWEAQGEAIDAYNRRIDEANAPSAETDRSDPALNRSIKLAAQQELEKVQAEREKSVNDWFKGMAQGVNRMQVPPSQGLYYTAGGSQAARETLGVQRKMLQALTAIHERMLRGVKLNIDDLAI